jgi:hypothetical protein
MQSILRKKKGSALIIVMFILILLMFAGVGMLEMSEKARTFAIRESQDMASRICADAGLQKAIGDMNSQLAAGTFNDDDLPMSIGETLPNTGGAFSYKVTKNVSGEYVAVSVGARGDFRRVVEAVLTKKSSSFGLLSQGALTFANNNTISAYDSRDPTATNCSLGIATTSTTGNAMVFNAGTVVNADAYCGQGGNPSSVICVSGTATLNGTKDALATNPTIACVSMPSLADKGAGSLAETHISSNTTWTSSNSGKYYHLYIDDGKTLTISGNVTIGVVNTYNNGFLQVGTNSTIKVATGGKLIVYLDGNFNSGNNISLQYAGGKDPSRIQIYGTCAQSSVGWPQFNLHSTSYICAYVHAPYAHFNVVSGTTFYGAIVAKDMGFNDNCNVYYDVALADASLVIGSGGGTPTFTLKRWSESVSTTVPDWAY